MLRFKNSNAYNHVESTLLHSIAKIRQTEKESSKYLRIDQKSEKEILPVVVFTIQIF